MKYFTQYSSAVGVLTLVTEDDAIIGLWIQGQKYYPSELIATCVPGDSLPILQKAVTWLDDYFHGQQPNCSDLKLSPKGTSFQKRVWEQLRKIPYGQTVTYGAIAKAIAPELASGRTCYQAVGNAIARNPIMIIVPCHRVVNVKGELSGYSGGLAAKSWLLALESGSQITTT